MVAVPAPSATVTRIERLALGDPRWAAFVRARAGATVFHHPAWAGLLAECYGFDAAVTVLVDGDGRVAAGLPRLAVRGPFGGRRWVSLPFTDYCPVLGDEDAVGRLAELLAAGAPGSGGDGEVRAGLPARPGVYPAVNGVRHTLDLGRGPDELFRRFSAMHRRNVRRAERGGVTVHQGMDAADMDTFYRLHLLTRRRLGVPVQPRRFFDLLRGRLLGAGLGFVLTARVGGRPAAAAVFLAWNGTLIYKYGASDPRFWEARPNNLLFWTAIRRAATDGYHTMDWGRTDDGDHGLREFKRGWGTAEHPLVYAGIGAPLTPSAGRARRLMAAVIRRSPPWVCRRLGEALYRYAA